MALVTVADVQEALRRPLTPEEAAEAEDMVLDYQAELEALLGRSVERREFTESFVADDYGKVTVARGPIVSVSAVSYDGTAQASTSYTVRRDGLIVGAWTGAAVAVTYVGGWDAESARPARRAILERVVRKLKRREDDADGTDQVSVEGENVRYVPDGFTEAELRACSRLKLRHAT